LHSTNKIHATPVLLLLAAALFCIGIYGVITSRNAVRVLMSIELLLNANLNLMAFSNHHRATKGQVLLCL